MRRLYEICLGIACILIFSNGQAICEQPVNKTNSVSVIEKVRDYCESGLANQKSGKQVEAAIDYSKAILLYPDCWPALFGRGVIYRQNHIYDSSIADLSKAIELHPSEKAYMSRGAAFEMVKKYEEAIGDFTQAIQVNPDSAIAYNARALNYSYKGDFKMAIRDHSRAIELRPEDIYIYYRARGITYTLMGDYDSAIVDLTKAIELNPNDFQAFQARAVAFGYKGSLSVSLKDFEQTDRLKPDNLELFGKRGLVYLVNNRYDEAIADFTKAIDSNTEKMSECLDGRALAYTQKGELLLALADYTKIIKLKPGEPKPRFDRSRLYYQLKDYDKAWMELEEFKKLGGHPDPKFIEDMLKETAP